jgi:lipoprotein-anchoring transpeptidase ErfK/SrfK
MAGKWYQRRSAVGAGSAVAVAVAVGLVWALVGAGADEGAGDAASDASTTSSSSTSSSTTSSSSTSTTAAPTVTAPAGPAEHLLGQGSRGEEVQAAQQRLKDLRLDPGAIDGRYGQATMYAVQAFEKLHGLPPRGKIGDPEREVLDAPLEVTPLIPDGEPNRVEVDLKRQLLFLYKNNVLTLISHVSTGSGQKFCDKGQKPPCKKVAVTPIGSFRFSWRAKGWWEAPLGKLYNPVYFTPDGVAVHGSLSVPTYPASHGCVRIPMHIAEYFPSLVRRGDAVYVTDGRPLGPPAGVGPDAPPPGTKPATPGDDTDDTEDTGAPAATTTTSPATPSTSTSTTSTPTSTTTSAPVITIP